MKKLFGILLSVLIVFCISGNASATLVNCVFEGDVGYAFDNTGTIDFTTISSYSGVLVYDTSIADSSTSDISLGSYIGAIKEFTVALGSYEFSLVSSGSNEISVFDRSWDTIRFNADIVGPGAIGTIGASLELVDQDGLAFANDSLPEVLNLSDFSSSNRLLMGWSEDDFYVNGTYLTRFETAAPVPEPATMLLFSAGLAGLGVFRKKFKKA